MATTTFDSRSGVNRLSGRFDESTDLGGLQEAAGAGLKLDWSAVDAVTSLGTRRLLAYLEARPAGWVEFHACPPSLVDMFNMLPAMLKNPAHKIRIMSFLVPTVCDACSTESQALATPLDVTADKASLKTLQRCRCGSAQRLLVEGAEYLAFLKSLRFQP